VRFHVGQLCASVSGSVTASSPLDDQSSRGLESRRVTEVWVGARDGNGGVYGSGYLISGALVLTAGYLFARGSEQCEIRALGDHDWLPGTVVWRSLEDDAVLLNVSSSSGDLQDFPAVLLGRLATSDRVLCRAIGFPSFQGRREGERNVRDAEELVGEIHPSTGLKSGHLTIHVTSSTPMQGEGGSPWEGMGGAALFAESVLIGPLRCPATPPAQYLA
jgi:hypothetical protein